MKIEQECIECLINQSRRVSVAIGADEKLSTELTKSIIIASSNFDFDQSPPEIASSLYENMAALANRADLYEEQKRLATISAKKFIPFLEDKLQNSTNLLLDATKIAVAGNVIDLAAEVTFDLSDQLENIFYTDFAHDDFEKLKNSIERSTSLLYIGDNVGEHIFDHLYIQTLTKLYPNLKIYYMVRGNPIINDVTMKEANEAGFDQICSIIDSGVNTPGFAYNRANEFSKKLFDEADMIITKGMGNYECLSHVHRKNLFFLLKVKCSVVARSLNNNIGDIICKLNLV